VVTRSVVLADSDAFVRTGVRAVIGREKDLVVVGEAGDGAAALSLATRTSADVLIVDGALPIVNGVEVARRAIATRPATCVVLLSADEEPASVAAAFEAGARAYVCRQCSVEHLVPALRTALAGRIHLCPRLAERPAVAAAVTGGLHVAELSERERAILQLVAEGHSSREIAARLHRSVKTIEAARQAVTRKLGLSSVAELTKYAVRHGLTSLGK
jgi:DNA-binding NarL/FixJ family response regulator